MNKSSVYKITIITFFMSTLLLYSCKSSSPPVTFYTLTPMVSEGGGEQSKLSEDVRIGIGPARFPKLIERPQIVTRTSPGKVNLDEFHRWGGSLNEDFLNVIAQNLNFLTGSHQVLIYPWVGSFSPTCHIEFDVHQFDGTLDGAVLLNVTWTISKQGSENFIIKQSSIKQTVSGATYEDLVLAKSKAIETLSKMIVKELETMS